MSQIVVKDGVGNLATAALVTNTGQQVMAASLPVTIASDQTGISIIDTTPDAYSSASLTSSGVVGTVSSGACKADTQGSYTAIIELSGTWVGTVSFYETINGTSYSPIKGTLSAGGGSVSSTTSNGQYIFNCGGYKEVWAVVTSYTSGTVSVSIASSIAQQGVNATVFGGSAEGIAPSYPPVYISGKDSGGLKRGLLVETSGAVILSNNSVPSLATDVVSPLASAQPVRLIGQRTWQAKFTDVNASALSSNEFTQLYKSSGITLSQASGALAVVASATANEEWLAVSNRSWNGALSLRQKTILSQRIANNNFWVILGDRIGNGLTLTVNSSTSVTVSAVPGTWSASNVGQFMFMGAVGGLAGMTPGRFAIASVSGSDITFTVPAMGISSGTTTCSLFGWNHAKILYTSTTATNAAFDTQLNGWASGDTTATINTSASPGHLGQVVFDGRDCFFEDALVASSTTPAFTTRSSRYSFIPDETTNLFVYLWVQNGTTNPASITTWTLQEIAVENFPNNPVFLAGNKQQGQSAPMPVNISQATATNISTNMAQVGGTTTVNGGVSGTLAVGGNTGGGDPSLGSTGVQLYRTTAINPFTIAGINPYQQVVRNKTTDFGEQMVVGALEWVSQFTFPTGSATATEGSNAKTLFIPPVEGFVDVDFSNIGTSPTFKISANYGGSLWEDIPAQRVDNTAAASALNIQLVNYNFTPVNQSKWRAKVYGAIAIRVHQTALTAGTYSTGTVRFVPREDSSNGALTRGFTLGATTTASVTGLTTQEIAGALNGAVTTTASLVTLINPFQGGARLSLTLDGFVSTSSTGTVDLTPEGSLDLLGSAWYTMQIANLGGGLYTNSYVRLSTTDIAKYEIDATPFKAVRVRRSALNVATTQSNVFGAVKIAPLSKQQVMSGLGTVTSFASTAEAAILTAQPYRKLVTIQNEGAGVLYVLGVPGTASSTNYTASLSSGDILNLASAGAIRGIFASAGTARVTEFV